MVRVLPRLARLKSIAVDLLFPKWCVGCGKEGDFICQTCRNSLPLITPPVCPLCGRPQTSAILCPNCASWQSNIDGIRSPFRFDGVIRQAVHQLKYKNLRALTPLLAELLYSYLINKPVTGEILVPIPLHQRRLRERGYNQSKLLAQRLGKLINLPVVEGCLIRLRHTPPQAKTSTVEERRNNLINAFACQDHRLSSRQILLIDDVSTSGATLDACARALKAAGATSVWGLVLAREV